MACGEALARGFILGQKAFTAVNARPAGVLWLPDVFGYCASLPQIMRQTGVESFFTTKLTWSNINRFPYSSFIWRGPDGSEVVCHITQETGYNQCVSVRELRAGSHSHRQSDVHDEFLAPTGYGDGGGGVTDEMCERARRLQSAGGLPEVAWGSVEEFFRKLGNLRAGLPVWQGELYLEYHRGTLTSHSELKHCFRLAERALQAWEAVRCATGGKPLDDAVWKRMVFAQFHDHIPGSSVWEVYEESVPELKELANASLKSSIGELSKADANKSAALFNPLPLPRVLIEDNGRRAVRMAPLSGAPAGQLEPALAAGPARCGKSFLSSAGVDVEFNRHGLIARLAFGGVEIPLRDAAAQPVIHPDYPHNFDVWDIDRSAMSLESGFSGFECARCSGDGSLRASVSYRGKLGERSTAVVTYSVDAFRKVLFIDYDIKWREQNALLRILFPTAFSGVNARFGAPFGSVLRGQQPGDPRTEAKFESAGSRWMTVEDDGGVEGLSLITEAKYGFSCREGTAGVSILRGVRVSGEDRGSSRLLPPALRRGGKREPFTDQGTHHIRLALAPSSPSQPREETAAALAETLYGDVLAYHGGPLASGFAGLQGGESLVPCWAKPANDGNGWILRMHEVLGRRGEAELVLAPGFTARLTGLMEEPKGGSVRKVRFDPYELVSVRMTRTSNRKK
jgi:alpha-mannosidase